MIDKKSGFELIEPNMAGVPVKIIKRDNGDGEPGHRLSPLHFHDEIEIICVYSGEMEVILADGSSRTVKKGETVCFDSRVLHSTYCGKEDLRYCVIQFRSSYFGGESKGGYEKYLAGFSETNANNFMVTDDREIFDCVMSVCSEYEKKENGYYFYIMSGVYRVLGFFYKSGFWSEQIKKDGRLIKRLLPVLEYVDENYRECIDISEMSGLLGVSKYHFCRLWKSAVGASFVDYLNCVRIRNADRLLRKTDMSVLDIALDTGFTSLSYFNRVFKKIKNCTPSVYRKASMEMLSGDV